MVKPPCAFLTASALMSKTLLMNFCSPSQPLFAMFWTIESNLASSRPGSAASSRKKREKFWRKSGFLAASSSVSPSCEALHAVSRIPLIVAKPSFTASRTTGETAALSISGVLTICESAASFLSSEASILRVAAPGRSTTTSDSIVSSENTKSAMKSLTVSAVWCSSARGMVAKTGGALGITASATWPRSATMGFCTTISLSPLRAGPSMGIPATRVSISFISSSRPALFLASSAWRRSRSAFVVTFPSSARFAMSTSVPVL